MSKPTKLNHFSFKATLIYDENIDFSLNKKQRRTKCTLSSRTGTHFTLMDANATPAQ